MSCVICGKQSSQYTYDKTTGTTVSVCPAHLNSVFEYGTGVVNRDGSVRVGLNTTLTEVGQSVKIEIVLNN